MPTKVYKKIKQSRIGNVCNIRLNSYINLVLQYNINLTFSILNVNHLHRHYSETNLNGQ